MGTICVQRRKGVIKVKKLRRLGLISANVFGKSLPDPISIQLKESDTRRLFHQEREGGKLTLDLEGAELPVQIKEEEIDTIKGQTQHISFQTLTADEKVNSVIHTLFANDDKIPGQLDKMLMEIPYVSLPGDMIDTITVDLDGTMVGTILAVKDIPELVSDKIELEVDSEEIVFCVSERKYHVEVKKVE